ncbi:MAG: histidine phosphatase family protein [Dehalococcoidia bacterium]|nr:histidine phosphatase family protein [Dehalococcoidia bacterium]
MTDTTLTLYLVRHPETDMNAARRLAGSTEAQLSPLGLEQAQLVTARFHGVPLTRVYSSPQVRCRVVAEQVTRGANLTLQLLGDLREAEMGEWEGREFSELERPYPQAREAWRSDPHFGPPGGESALAVWDRVQGALRTIVEHGPGAALVMSHGLTLRTALGALTGYTRHTAWNHYPFRLTNTSVTVAEVLDPAWPLKPGAVVLHKLNDTYHLSESAGA